MKLTIDRAAAASAITWVSRVLDAHPAQPILAGIKITAGTDHVTFAAFDWHTGHTARVPVDIDEPGGEAVVSGHFLRAVVADALTDPQVGIAIDGRELVVTGKRATYRTALMPALDYPTLPTFPEPAGTIAAATFTAAVAALRPAVDDNPPSSDLAALAGIRFETSDQGLELAATNRFILIRAALDWAGDNLTATVPGKALEAAIKGMTGTLSLGVEGGVFGIGDDARHVTTRLIDAVFPEAWRRLIRPAADDTFEVAADGDELRATLNRTSKLTDSRTPTVTFTITEDEVEISTSATEHTIGSGTDYVPVTSAGAGDFLHVPKRLADALTAMGTSEVRIGVSTTTGHPFVIRPAGNDDREAVVMPIRKR